MALSLGVSDIPMGLSPQRVNVHFTSISLLPGCLHRAQDEGAPSEQGVSAGTSQVRTPKPGPSIQDAQPCETCGLLLKDLLHLAEHDGTHPGLGLYTCGEKPYQNQKHQIREKLSKSDEGRSSLGIYSMGQR